MTVTMATVMQTWQSQANGGISLRVVAAGTNNNCDGNNCNANGGTSFAGGGQQATAVQAVPTPVNSPSITTLFFFVLINQKYLHFIALV